MGNRMRFQTLGPLRVYAAGGWSAIGAAHQRVLPAVLLIEAGEVVSTARLVREIWGDRPPRTAVHAIHVYVRRLRAPAALSAAEETAAAHSWRTRA